MRIDLDTLNFTYSRFEVMRAAVQGPRSFALFIETFQILDSIAATDVELAETRALAERPEHSNPMTTVYADSRGSIASSTGSLDEEKQDENAAIESAKRRLPLLISHRENLQVELQDLAAILIFECPAAAAFRPLHAPAFEFLNGVRNGKISSSYSKSELEAIRDRIIARLSAP